jgi:hypothetical protein
MKTIRFCLFFLLTFFVVGSIAGANKEIRFSAGSNSATVSQSVIRGDRDLYSITAKAGQTMEISITSKEDNAVFAIFQPGSKPVKEDGITEVKGTALPKAGDKDDARSWSGKLPESGKYWIIVGGTRGNATYKLKVTIK